MASAYNAIVLRPSYRDRLPRPSPRVPVSATEWREVVHDRRLAAAAVAEDRNKLRTAGGADESQNGVPGDRETTKAVER